MYFLETCNKKSLIYILDIDNSFERLFRFAQVFLFIILKIIEPRAKNIPVNQEKLRRFQSELETTLDHLENVFLRNHNYLAGDDISIADIHCICELMQPMCAGQDVQEGRPKLTEWMERVRQRLHPYFEEAHKFVYVVRSKFLKGNL